jgi:ADP-heptose:LPS heptosyltransferase
LQTSKIIISRTDNIGDVILTLPLTGLIKKSFPDVKIAFLGTNYTKAIIENCAFVDEFYDLNDIRRGISFFSYINATTIVHVFPRKEIARLAKAAGIEKRIGTSHRIYHWWTCNKLVNLGRKRSNLHIVDGNIQPNFLKNSKA